MCKRHCANIWRCSVDARQCKHCERLFAPTVLNELICPDCEKSDSIRVRAAGYEWALRNPAPADDYTTDGALADYLGKPPTKEQEAAWYAGIRDAKHPNPADYMSGEQAAAHKGVSLRTIYRVLNDRPYQLMAFPHAMKGSRDWWLRVDEVEAWQPRGRGRPKSE